MYKGFIFDFDGLILDTEKPRYIAWKEIFAEYGITLTYRDWWKAIGTGPSCYDPGKHVSEISNGKYTSEQLREITDVRALELMKDTDLLPGVRTFLETADAAGIPMVIASSSSSDWVTWHLERYGILPFFNAVLTAQDVKNVKPDPDLYLLALQRLSLPADSVLAFEDSPNGITAAKNAGLRCIAIPNEITGEMDLSAADLIVSSMTEISPDTAYPWE